MCVGYSSLAASFVFPDHFSLLRHYQRGICLVHLPCPFPSPHTRLNGATALTPATYHRLGVTHWHGLIWGTVMQILNQTHAAYPPSDDSRQTMRLPQGARGRCSERTGSGCVGMASQFVTPNKTPSHFWFVELSNYIECMYTCAGLTWPLPESTCYCGGCSPKYIEANETYVVVSDPWLFYYKLPGLRANLSVTGCEFFRVTRTE